MQCLVVFTLFSLSIDARADLEESFAADALTDTAWFDADNRSVRPVTVKPSVDDSQNRDSRWLPKAKRVPAKKKAPATPAGGGGGGGVMGSGLTIGNLFGWFLLAMIVVTIISFLVYAFSKAEIDLVSGGSASAGSRGLSPDEQTIERMKHLPAELRRTDVNMRSEAERLMNEGKYDQAIILLFAHQLLLLDFAGILRLNRGKTNGKYVRETRSVDQELGKMLRHTTTAFEKSYFGRQSIDAQEMTFLWEQNQLLEATVKGYHEVAA